jgi:hypothetical protein
MADAVIPLWVDPTAQQIEDAHRIAYAVAVDGGGYRWQARSATFDWVTGLQDAAPVTGRRDPDGLEPTEAVARGEMLSADAVTVDLVLASEFWELLGVEELPPLTTNHEWCDGVAGVLGWLLGTRSAPIRTPRRNRDGTVMTADQLYREKAAAQRILPPEDRARLRTEAEVEAGVYRRLATLADSSRGRPLTRT